MEALLTLRLFKFHSVSFHLVVTISISWFASYCDGACHPFRCGEYVEDFPFGAKNSGCGDPTLQLECDHKQHMPLITISGSKYYLLEPKQYFDHNYAPVDVGRAIKIIDKNLWEDKCNLSSNVYAQFWNVGSEFRVADVYRAMTLGKQCTSQNTKLFVDDTCNGQRYYNLSPGSTNVTCQSTIELPVLNPEKPLAQSVSEGIEVAFAPKHCNSCLPAEKSCNSPNILTASYCFCSGISYSMKCPTGKPRTVIVLGSTIGGGLVLVTILGLLLFFIINGRKRPAITKASWQGRPIGNLPIFSYEELEQATNFFNEQNEVGDGGFGSIYLGKLKDGRTVAVKRLYQDNSRRVEQFINEVGIVSSLHHPNLVSLYGATSSESPVLLLVYEFLPNGTLADHLHGNRKGSNGLPWETRLDIAIDTAQGLAFLHSVDPPIFHRDVKSNNILLDNNFRAKVADFGLSRFVPLNATHVTTAPQGTPGYLDPEYHQCYHLTEKSDVYSFAVVLAEIISAKLPVDVSRTTNEISLANMAAEKVKDGALHELVDPQLEIEKNEEVKLMVTAVAKLAVECLASDRDLRPDMRTVADRLEKIKELQNNCIGQETQLVKKESSKAKYEMVLSPTSVHYKPPSISSEENSS